jgi:4-amino-4-deoxy-L-arabinose transferase-like glycosyltransferase
MSIFGQSIHAIHLGLLLINVATIALIFLVGRRLINTMAGVTAAASYAVLSVSPSVLGLAAHATNFVILPVLSGILLLLKEQRVTAPEPSQPKQLVRLFASGLLFGIGALMKQPGLLFIPFGAIYIVWNDLNRRLSPNRILLRILIFVTGAAVPLGVTSLILWYAGVFDRFWVWTINYAWEYGSLVPLSQARQIFFRSANEVVFTGWPVWILAGIGALIGLWDQPTRASILFLIGFLFFSALAVCPGFYFRTHYFILLLPAVSLLAGAALSKLMEILEGRAILIRFIPLFVFAVALERANPIGQKHLLRGFPKPSVWTDLSRQSISGICSDWHLHARTYRTGGHNCRLGLRTRDLFLFPSAFGDRIHLHLWFNGVPKIRAADATGND